MFQDAWKSVVMKVTGEVAPATAPQVAPESVGSKKKKRTRDEVSSSTSQEIPNEINNKAPLTNEPVPKRPRTDKYGLYYQGRIDFLTSSLLKIHTDFRRSEGRHLPLTKEAASTVRSNIQTVIDKMRASNTELFESKMKDFVPVFQNLYTIKLKASDENRELKEAKRLVEMWARDFLDGPLLFNAWPYLPGACRQVLSDLRLQLDQIRIHITDLRSGNGEEQGSYAVTGEEAESRCAQILRVLHPGKDHKMRSYDDVETRNRHNGRLEKEVASMTAANEQRANVVSRHDDLSTGFKTLVGALVDGNAATADVLKAIVSHQTTTPGTTPPNNAAPATATPNTTASAPSAASVSSTEEQARAVHGVQQGKMGLMTTRKTQEKEAWYKKVEDRMWLYDQAIYELGIHQYGGPIPTSVVALQVPDVQACYIRLVQLWKDLDLNGTYDLQKLRTCKDSLYSFAISMREAHFLLHLLVFYGDSCTNLGETGWSLSHMRWLQSDMVPYASELPLVHSKSDVDMICQVLEKYCPEQPLLKRQFVSVDTPAAVDTMLTDGHCPYFAQGICRNINTCTLGHPEHLRKAAACADLNTHGICKWGLGCSYAHIRLQPDAAQIHAAQLDAAQFNTVQLNAAQALVPHVNTAVPAAGLIAYALNGRGEQVNALDPNNYCKNWYMNKCNNDQCPRIHQNPPQGLVQQLRQVQLHPSSDFSNVNHFQNGGQGAQSVSQPATNNTQVCRQFAKGEVCKFGDKCRFSHNVTQQVGDTQMGGAAVNGDNHNAGAPAAVARNPRFNKPCKNETNGRACSNNNCMFIHSNLNSRTYATTNQAAIAQAQSLAGGNLTFVPGQPVVFAQPQATKTMPPPPVPNNNNGMSNITCHGCGQIGHKKNDCSQRSQGGAQQLRIAGNVTCHGCGQVGHKKNNCTGGQGGQGGQRSNQGGRRGNQRGNQQRGSRNHGNRNNSFLSIL
ncbi:hypothetical protein B5807_09983 [Epicoccum nigrum]|uniref:Uncharacterized protein n=1 Tax=Epicoccum nigrum TaxID=105696 RepID=A0A1Y2LU34_EPING|nr:hypothetical protein B5807_09983 [Epicoccum nigrum]